MDPVSIGMGVASVAGAAGGLISGITNPGKDRKLLIMQQQYEREVAERNQEKYEKNLGLSYDYNKKAFDYQIEQTNALNQRKRLEEAGLSPALMYGQNGAGGAGGSMSGAQGSQGTEKAPDASAYRTNEINAMGLGLNASRLLAEVKNIQADTKMKEAEAESKTEGLKVMGSQIDKLKSETKNQQLQYEINEIEKSIKVLSATDQVYAIGRQAKILAEDLRAIERSNEIGEETKESVIQETKERAIGAKLSNSLTTEQTKKVTAEIKQEWEKIKQGWSKLSNEQQQIEINKTAQKLIEKMPGLDKLAGKILNQGIEHGYKVSEALDKTFGTERTSVVSDWNITK